MLFDVPGYIVIQGILVNILAIPIKHCTEENTGKYFFHTPKILKLTFRNPISFLLQYDWVLQNKRGRKG